MSSGYRFAVPDVPERFPARCPFSGLPIRTRPEWCFTNREKTYRTSIAMIGEYIFWVIPRGYVDLADMQGAIAMAAAIKAEVNPDDTPFVFIENFAHTKGGTAGARRLYLEFTNTLKGLLGSFPYGLPPFFRLSFNLTRRLRLHHYKVRMVPRYEDAVRCALEMLERHGVHTPVTVHAPPRTRLEEPLESGFHHATPPAGAAIPTDDPAIHRDLLLSHLGRLDLERTGIPEIPAVVHGGPMQPVYEALMVLKMDMDQFLEEHRGLMEVLQERHQNLQTKTAAIETRNRELQTLLQISAEDQKQLGENARHMVQALLKPLVAMIARETHSPAQREWIDGLNDRIDDLARDLLPHFDLHSYGFTPQELKIARLIRDGVRSKAIARQLGVSVRTVESFRGRLRAKLGIQGQARNLRTILLAIPDR